MTRRKNNKRALTLSLLSLLLCMAMLVGSTFAWFTDSASTGVNTIQAGTLDIDLIDKNNDSLVGKTLGFKTEAGEPGKDEHGNILWEPGCTFELEQATLVNNGNLWAKYQVIITAANGAADGDVDLAKVIEVYEGDTKIGTLREVLGMTSIKEGAIAPKGQEGSSLSFNTIKLHMMESAGNEYQGKSLESISITVNATQKDAEFDSFDNKYDEDATFSTPVSTPEELTKALANAQSGNTITLAEDITVDALTVAGGNAATIDLAGRKLIVNNINSDGMVVSDGATLNLVNTGSEKTTIEFFGENTRYDAIFVDNATFSVGGNVDIVVSPKASSAIHATNNAVVNINEGTNVIVEGETPDQFSAIFVERGATVNMTGGTVNVESNLTVEDNGWNDDAVGVVLRGADAKFNMTGGNINVHSKNAMAQGVQISTENGVGSCVVNLDGGTFNVTNEGIQGGSYAFAFFDTRATGAEIKVSNTTFMGNYTAAVMNPFYGTAADANVILNGGTFAFNPDGYVGDGHTAVDNGNGTWTVQ